MQHVSFTQMKDGTKDDYIFLQEKEREFANNTAERLLHYMSSLNESLPGYPISRLEHSLQSATRAWRDGADIDMVVGALLHDIGDLLSPYNHAEFAAAILRPYVHEKCAWVIEKHAIFQKYYYAHHYGWDREERQKYKDHPYYQDCVDFCEKWDQASFDPTYQSEDLAFFAPMLREVFARKTTHHG
jgi:predicted HD phosphohydrolase